MWTQIQASGLNVARAAEIEALPLPDILPSRSHCIGALQMRGATIKHNGGARQLCGVSLSIEPGEIIGITGASGGGKSDLLAALCGRKVPVAGTVEIDGVDIMTPDGQALLRSVRMIDNKPVTFNGTILENITMFRGGAAVAAAINAAQAIGLNEMVNLLPEGYETKIGSGSSTLLTPGVIQLIVIARALSANPKILVIDEVSGALDHNNHRCLRQAFGALRGRMTIVIASVQQPYLKLADRIFEIVDDRLLPHPGFSSLTEPSLIGAKQPTRQPSSFAQMV